MAWIQGVDKLSANQFVTQFEAIGKGHAADENQSRWRVSPRCDSRDTTVVLAPANGKQAIKRAVELHRVTYLALLNSIRLMTMAMAEAARPAPVS